MIELYNADYRCLGDLEERFGDFVIVTDPPFNIGYHYSGYKDNIDNSEYMEMLSTLIMGRKSVVIHYPERLYELAMEANIIPSRTVSWVYNSNTPRQHRDIAFFNVEPDFTQVKQPYKNPNDKRIKERIAKGATGAKLYDWWNVNQVKNTSAEKTAHPCQMPLEVMKRIIGILPDGITILDPFMGSGTTGVAAKELGRSFIGIELDENYYKIAEKRIAEATEATENEPILRNTNEEAKPSVQSAQKGLQEGQTLRDMRTYL